MPVDYGGGSHLKLKRIFLVFVMVLLLAQVALSTKKVLLVQSYDPEYKWSQSIDRGVKEALRDGDFDIQTYYMDARLRNTEEWKIKAGKMVLEVIDAYQPDIIIASDDDAQKYFARTYEYLPIVFCGVNQDPAVYGYPRKNVTGVAEVPYYEACVAFARELFPSISKILFLGDEGATTAGMLEQAQSLVYPGIDLCSGLAVPTFESWRQIIEDAPVHYDAIFLTAYRVLLDEYGNSVASADIADWTVRNSAIPVFALSDYMVEDGLLGGVVQSPFLQAYHAALMAKEILFNNREPGDIPIAIIPEGERMMDVTTATSYGFDADYLFSLGLNRVFGDFGLSAKTVLQAMQQLFETTLAGALTALRIIALLPEAKTGDWQTLKPYLKMLENQYPGVAVYGFPDGSYYSVARNLTGLYLNDRAYFPSLLNGLEVKGSSVYSRSTGKRTAVIGIPILSEGAMISFVGLSMYLDQFVTRLREKIHLPDGIDFYLFDENGTCVLSNREILEESIENPISGYYENIRFQKESEGSVLVKTDRDLRIAFYQKSSFNQWMGVLTKQLQTYDTEKKKPGILLQKALTDVSTALAALDNALYEATERVSESLDSEEAIRNVMKELIASRDSIVDVTFVDRNGIMTWIEPAEYRGHEGTDISDQEQVKRLFATKKPVLSDVFLAVEGFPAMDLEWPVFDEDGTLAGSLSVLLKPEAFFYAIADPESFSPSEFWVMHPSGTIVHDQDREEIGRNLFSDPLYAGFEDLRKLGETIASNESGEGVYTFYAGGTDTVITKKTLWKTVSLHGTELKLILTYP
jgi:ABC-type uncharacterized transport system substrate-binding protein